MSAAVSEAAGRGGQAPAALVALHEFSNGRPIEQVRSVLGLTHSATVRLVDALEADGLVVRRPSADDRRSIAVTLTAAGRRRADRIAQARREAVEAGLAALDHDDQRALTRLMERLVSDTTALRLRERQEGTDPAHGWLCRLCDFDACGRGQGRCPAVAAVAEARPHLPPLSG